MEFASPGDEFEVGGGELEAGTEEIGVNERGGAVLGVTVGRVVVASDGRREFKRLERRGVTLSETG